MSLTVIDGVSYEQGTPITWKSSGGTNAITCTSLAAGAARQGVKSATLAGVPPNGPTGTVLPDRLAWTLVTQHTTAPAAGGTDELYLGFSDSATAGTDNPGGLNGTDAALGNVDQLPQLQFAGACVLSNSLGTGVQQSPRLITGCPCQYVSPVIFNNGSTAFDATALHTVLTCTPMFRVRAA